MRRDTPFQLTRGLRYHVLAFAVLHIVRSEVLPSQQSSQTSRHVADESTEVRSLGAGTEAGLIGRIMRSEQLTQKGADPESLEAAQGEQERGEENSAELHTLSSSDVCEWATWHEWGTCTKSCGNGTRTRSRLGTGLYAQFYYFTQGDSLPDLASRSANVKRIDLVVGYQDTLAAWKGLSKSSNFAARWTGNLLIRKGGKYSFELSSHDGARFKLDGQTVLEHNGLGRPTDMDPMIVKSASKVLASGKSYSVEITYFEKTGRSGILWKYSGPDTGDQKIIVPASQLRHPPALSACVPKKTEAGACALQECAIDCTWSTWSAWSTCSSTCAGGTTRRTRAIKFYKNYGGAECTGKHNETTDCNSDKACPCETGDCQA